MSSVPEELRGEVCVVCNRPATTYYPPDLEEADPSCGRPRCELMMQHANDYQAEAGDR